MRILNLARKAYGKAASEPRILGGSGFAGGYGLRNLLSGSSFDYWREAGPIYDNSIAQNCINFLWRKFPELKWQIHRQVEPGVWKPDAGPKGADLIVASLKRPNEAYDGSVLMQSSALSHCCRGNAFWLVRRDRAGIPLGYWWAYNSQIRAMSNRDNAAGTKLVTHYEYTPIGGIPEEKDLDEVVHFRWGLDPVNPAYGLSPWMGQLREICTDNESGTHMAALLRNGACPGTVIIPDVDVAQAPTDSQRSKFSEIWRSFTRDNKGEPLMAPFRVKLERTGLSPEEMVLDKVRSIPAGRICGAIGLDPMVLAIDTQHQTFSNYEQALRSAILNCLMPIAWLFAEQLSARILPEFGVDPDQYQLGWNTDRVVGLQEDTDALHKRWRDHYKAGVVDRFTAKERIGEKAEESDREVYSSPKAEPDQQDPDREQDDGNEDAR